MKKTNSNKAKRSFNDIFENIKVGNYGGFGFNSLEAPLHYHNDYYEITLVTSGVYIHTYKGHNYNLTPGTLVLMAPHSEHQLYTEPMQATFYAICIQEDYFHDFIKQHFPNFISNSLPQCTTLHLDTADFTYLEQLGRQMSVSRPALYVADTITYLTLLNIFYKKNQPTGNRVDHVQRILTILSEPSNLQISAQAIYELANIPPATLIKSFKEQTGFTIVEYKNKKRMELAAHMLRTSNKKIIDIAYELHYESLSYFLRSFKKEFNMTPTEYRKIYQKMVP